jgi:enamine deaminase RidA (YjgF/YER057c/UK114 family)
LPIGLFSHVAEAGEFIIISGVAGVNPETGKIAGDARELTIQGGRSPLFDRKCFG